MIEAPNHMLKQTVLNGNKEYCEKSTYTFGVPEIIFFREPRSHVLSQFLECKYDEWGQQTTLKWNFPGYLKLNDTMLGFDTWVKHFNDIALTKFREASAYNCYDPFNMQTRYLTMEYKECHFAKSAKGRWPNITVARQVMDRIQVVGIVAHYPASLCLFEYFAGGQKFLTENCQVCEDGRMKVAKTLSHETHGVPKHSISTVSNKTLAMIDEMTRIDKELYEIALERFYHQVSLVQNTTGVDLLCRNSEATTASPTMVPTALRTNEEKTASPTSPTASPAKGGAADPNGSDVNTAVPTMSRTSWGIGVDLSNVGREHKASITSDESGFLKIPDHAKYLGLFCSMLLVGLFILRKSLRRHAISPTSSVGSSDSMELAPLTQNSDE